VPSVPPVQQPSGQETLSQAQPAPVVSQSPFAHAEHIVPAVPQTEGVCDANGTHVLPWQHPFGHDVASHTHWPLPLSQSSPAAHALQATPPLPHDAVDSAAYVSHVSPLQQPFGHEVASQVHVPLVVLQS
jgi:hypothetical protein